MKKYPVGLFVLITAFTPMCNAADYGLGVSATSSESTVFLPINLNNNYRVEPYLQYYRFENNTEKEVQQSVYKVKYSTQEVGVGVFKTLPLQDNISSYFGLRVSYVVKKQHTEYSPYSSKSESKLTGYSVSPAIGFEYSFTEKFALGMEAEWRYQNIDGGGEELVSGFENFTEHSNEKSKTTGTNTRITMRYFF